MCETIYASLEQCCPALYLERAPVSAIDVRAGLPKLYVYPPRTLILSQLAGTTSITRDSDSGQTEQLSDIIAYGSDEVWECLHPGVEQEVTALSLYARYCLAELLDHRDWMALGKAVGLEMETPDPDTDEDEDLKGPVSVYSVTDGVLSEWVQTAGPAATVRALHTALQSLERTDAASALLSLTPLYRYVNKDNNNDLHNDLLLQGQKGHLGHQQRPVSSSTC